MFKKIKNSMLLVAITLFFTAFRCEPEKIDLTINNLSNSDIVLLRKKDISLVKENIKHNKMFKIENKILSKHFKVFYDFKYNLDFYLSLDNQSYNLYFLKYDNNKNIYLYKGIDSIVLPVNRFKIGKLRNTLTFENDKIIFNNN